MILVTTSRRPSRRTRSFAKDLSKLIFSTYKINRGKLSLKGLLAEALLHKADKILIIETFKGNPGKISLYKICEKKHDDKKDVDMILYAKIFLRGVVLTRDRNIKFCGYIKDYSIDFSECIEEPCENIIKIVRELFGEEEKNQNKHVIKIKKENDTYIISFRKAVGEDCGPMIKISKIFIYQDLCEKI